MDRGFGKPIEPCNYWDSKLSKSNILEIYLVKRARGVVTCPKMDAFSNVCNHWLDHYFQVYFLEVLCWIIKHFYKVVDYISYTVALCQTEIEKTKFSFA